MRTSTPFVFIACASLAAAQAIINTPSSLIYCQPVALTWSGGSAPYYVSIIPGGQPSGPVLENLGTFSGDSTTWTVDIAAGTSITLQITDSTGKANYAQAVTIQPGSTTTCPKAGAAAAGSASSPAAAPAAAAATTSTSKHAPGAASKSKGTAKVSTAAGAAATVATTTPVAAVVATTTTTTTTTAATGTTTTTTTTTSSSSSSSPSGSGTSTNAASPSIQLMTSSSSVIGFLGVVLVALVV